MKFRPRFGLRTLFVLTALISLPLSWVAYQLNWIRDRKAAEVRAGFPQFVSIAAKETLFSRTTKELPFGLRLLGEQPVPLIHSFESSEKVEKLRKLFPEADVIYI